ncbi:MAG: hypothetical protein ACYC1M_17025 [Armatimonadota bacterium]
MDDKRAEIIKKKIGIQRNIYTALWMPALILFLTARNHPITSSVLVYAICFSLPFVFMMLVLIMKLVEVLKNRQERLLEFNSRPRCYKLLNCRSDVIPALVGPVILIAFSLAMTVSVLSEIHSGIRLGSYMWLAIFVPGVFIMLLQALLDLAKSLTAHVCITEEGIGIETIVNDLRLHAIGWEQVTSMKVKREPISNAIKRVIVNGRTKRGVLRPIIIPGNDPDILRILQDVREHAPDKMNEVS